MNMSQRFVEHTYQLLKYLTVWKLIGKQGISRGRIFQKKVGCENYASSHTGRGEWELLTHNICLSDLSLVQLLFIYFPGIKTRMRRD